jgi:hypothetical protein
MTSYYIDKFYKRKESTFFMRDRIIKDSHIRNLATLTEIYEDCQGLVRREYSIARRELEKNPSVRIEEIPEEALRITVTRLKKIIGYNSI